MTYGTLGTLAWDTWDTRVGHLGHSKLRMGHLGHSRGTLFKQICDTLWHIKYHGESSQVSCVTLLLCCNWSETRYRSVPGSGTVIFFNLQDTITS